MPVTYQIIIILILLILILFILWRRTAQRCAQVAFSKNSLSSKYGKISEQFMPFLKNFPYDPGNFRFLGSPIDGIQFEDDKIIFIEFKSADSQLSHKQKKIAELVWQKKVEFYEMRLK